MLTTLLALSILAPQAAEQAQGGFESVKRQVPTQFPSADSPAPPPPILAWDGWGYGTDLRAPRPIFAAVGDWSSVAKAELAADAVPWRMKVVVFTQSDILDRNADGLVRQRRSFLDAPNLEEVMQAVARYRPLLATYTSGKLRFEPDVSVETEALRFDSAETDFGRKSVLQWIESNVNGGTYQAEDGVYRGPFHGVVAIVPAGVVAGEPLLTSVNGTPVVVAHLTDNNVVPGQIEHVLDRGYFQQVDAQLERHGYTVDKTADANTDPHAVAAMADPSAEALRASSGVKTAAAVPAVFLTGAKWIGASWKGKSTEVSLVPDSERGQVLRVKETGLFRSGGVALPLPEGGFAGRTLTFFAKSKSTDPMALFARNADGKTLSFALGQEFPSPSESPVEAAIPTSFEPNGAWQKVSIDLRPVGTVQEAWIGPTPRSPYFDRRDATAVEYEFDDFQLSDEPVSASQPKADPVLEEAMKAVALGKEGKPSPELAKMLLSPHDLVVLNALAAYTTVKDPTVLPQEVPLVAPKDPKLPLPKAPVVPDLRKAMAALSPRRQEYGLRAIAHQDVPEGWSFIRRQMVVGASGVVRGTGIELLANRNQPNLLADVILLSTTPTRFAKLRALQALAQIEKDEAGEVLGTFLRHDDPVVRQYGVSIARTVDDNVLRKVMWYAVNDPSDAVRLESLKKLVQSKDAKIREEGYKGVRDDSQYVRTAFIDWMRANPSANHVPALMLAISDNSYRTRVQALKALAVQPGELQAAALQPLAEDPYEPVRQAYRELAQAKGLSGGS